MSVLALGFALQFVTVRATRSAEAQLRQGLHDSAVLVERTYASRVEALTTSARLLADLPLLKALVATGDAATVVPVAQDYAARIKAPYLAFANREGRVLARVGPLAAPSSFAGPLDVDLLLDDPGTGIIVCCGSGGVGKTTTSAALALRAAERGRKVVVLTIDPARRLAQSMGIAALHSGWKL